MKTLLKLCFFATCMAFVVACSKSEIKDENNSDATFKSAQLITVTLPFEAHLLGTPTLIIMKIRNVLSKVIQSMLL